MPDVKAREEIFRLHLGINQKTQYDYIGDHPHDLSEEDFELD